MRLHDLPAYVRDTVLRMLPHRTRTGLRRVGHPGRDAPVLLTGNFTLTVRRLRDVLRGRDAFILVADSRGINVWCAAGGGHLTHHDVISAIRTSGVADQVDRKEVILPQLSATGVERRKITEATGFDTRWGPARLEDLPAFLDRGRRVHKDERKMRFPFWERMEMAAMWGVPTLVIGGLIVEPLGGLTVLAAVAASLVTIVVGVFALLPWLKVGPGWRWPTLGAFTVLGFGVASVVLALLGRFTSGPMMWVGASSLLSAGILSADLEGTTPSYGSYINTFHNPASVDLVEEKCTGAADCVQVCPRDVLQMDGKRRKVAIARPDQCIQCGACVVQCPESALRFRYADGSVVEAETIRRTRMNMVGKRTVPVPD
ncbi:MAG: 4Fe-4S dicluster domain-containing protein [Gemmatimonadetes bacterium]|nr:4Fe-4S dicluster domain-containing protein [Gemmatimonadota bacterium]